MISLIAITYNSRELLPRFLAAVATPWVCYFAIAPLMQRYSPYRISAFTLIVGSVPLVLSAVGQLVSQDWGSLRALAWGAFFIYCLFRFRASRQPQPSTSSLPTALPVVAIALVILGDALGIYGGYLVSVRLLGANPLIYEQNTFNFIEMNDIWSGLIKSAFFGLILTLTGCVRGYYTTGGAEGVGKSTTNAVVSASLIILLADFFLTKILF